MVGIGMRNVIKMSSANPAKVYGAVNKGSIEKGKDADLIVIDDDYNVLYTISEGRIVYDHQKDTDVFNDEFLAAYKIA